jgi:hypothetical protein
MGLDMGWIWAGMQAVRVFSSGQNIIALWMTRLAVGNDNSVSLQRVS